MNHCLLCGNTTTNPKYCSRSCSAKDTNRKQPKRRTNKKCIVCGDTVKSYRHNRCEEHWIKYQETRYKNKTLGEYRNKQSVKGKHPSWIHSHVRQFCRSWLKHLTEKPCANCGYDKHVELCHIKPIASFPDTAKLSEVNSEENVIQLCRNCHWEFDNNLLTLGADGEIRTPICNSIYG